MDKRIVYILILVLSFGSVAAFDFTKSIGNGTAQTIMMSNPSASEIVNLPVVSFLDSGITVDMGLNRSFNIKELDLGFLALAKRNKNLIYSFGFSQFGQRDYYSERLAKAGLGMVKNKAAFGLYLSYMNISFGGHYESVSALSFDLGFSYKTDKMIYGLQLSDFNSPKFSDQSENIHPKLSAYGELIGQKSYSLLARVSLQKENDTQLGVAQIIKLSSNASVFWGLSNKPSAYGGGINIFYKKYRISYSSSYHPVLGLSHTVTIGYNIFNKFGISKEDQF